MKQLLKEILHNKLLWLLAFVPMVFAASKIEPEAHTLLFVLSVLAIVPLAALLIPSAFSIADSATGEVTTTEYGVFFASVGVAVRDLRITPACAAPGILKEDVECSGIGSTSSGATSERRCGSCLLSL